MKDINTLLDSLSHIFVIGDGERKILKQTQRRQGFRSRDDPRKREVEDVSRLEVNAPDLPGLLISPDKTGDTPFAHDFSHVLGYVAAVSEKEVNGDPLLGVPGFKIGKNGVERVFDLKLRGKAGNSQVEVSAVGRVIQEARQDGEPGEDLFSHLRWRLAKSLIS